MDKLINDNSVITNLLVRSLLNPENELYIGSVTIEQLEKLLEVDTNKDGWVEVVRKAFHTAQALYIQSLENKLKGVSNMRQQLFNVFRVNDDKGISPTRVAGLRTKQPLQTVTLTHVAQNRWVKDGKEYTLKPCNSKQTFKTHIKGKDYILIATVLNGQISIFD